MLCMRLHVHCSSKMHWPNNGQYSPSVARLLVQRSHGAGWIKQRTVLVYDYVIYVQGSPDFNFWLLDFFAKHIDPLVR